MEENTQTTPTADVTPVAPEAQPTRLQNFVNKHPRAAKVVAITGAVTAAFGAVHFTRTVQANKDHAKAAGDHARDALNELANTASPTDTDG